VLHLSAQVLELEPSKLAKLETSQVAASVLGLQSSNLAVSLPRLETSEVVAQVLWQSLGMAEGGSPVESTNLPQSLRQQPPVTICQWGGYYSLTTQDLLA
jgi:uncharacterized protein YaaW (UPF0174 family)